MSQKRYLQIANFDNAQMYKDRNPIWIKLHCAILDDYEFAQIPDETKFHAVGLMILAARLNNKLPDDELWLRRKINASSMLNLKILLEIGFLEPIKGARNDVTKPKSDVTELNSAKKAAKKDVTKSLNARNSKKTKGEFVKQSESENQVASHRTEQNRTEENKIEHNITQQTRELSPDAENRVVVCDFSKSSKTESREKNQSGFIKGISGNGHSSMFSLNDCLRYVEQSIANGQEVRNAQGLANNLYKTGSADAFIQSALYPEQQQEAERAKFGEPIEFSDVPCSVCWGAKMADVGGKGYRRCEHCRDERGRATGLEPLGEKE